MTRSSISIFKNEVLEAFSRCGARDSIGSCAPFLRAEAVGIELCYRAAAVAVDCVLIDRFCTWVRDFELCLSGANQLHENSKK